MSQTILVVDGHVAVREIIQQALEKNGYKTIAVDDAKQALSLENLDDIHAMILNDDLEHVSGGNLCRQIKNRVETSRIPAILYGHSLRITHPDYIKATGADVTMLKPIPIDDLLDAVEAVLLPSSVS